jgi:hypothetical protein
MILLLGSPPKRLLARGEFTNQFFTLGVTYQDYSPCYASDPGNCDADCVEGELIDGEVNKSRDTGLECTITTLHGEDEGR